MTLVKLGCQTLRGKDKPLPVVVQPALGVSSSSKTWQTWVLCGTYLLIGGKKSQPRNSLGLLVFFPLQFQLQIYRGALGKLRGLSNSCSPISSVRYLTQPREIQVHPWGVLHPSPGHHPGALDHNGSKGRRLWNSIPHHTGHSSWGQDHGPTSTGFVLCSFQSTFTTLLHCNTNTHTSTALSSKAKQINLSSSGNHHHFFQESH